ncbi:hypothetical protein DFH28DRAFT_1100471 [Melampsora americana]|nr:hypothetical protein DFH28DRAFT_1100471 [Melampsora americana]
MNTGIDVEVDFTIWVPKEKSGKQSAEPSWEAAKPNKKIHVLLVGKEVLSFKTAKLQVFTAMEEIEAEAVTVLSAADIGEGKLGGLKWHAYISKSRVYPKTGDRITFITSDLEWIEWLRVCDVSRDKACGLSLVMENPSLARRKKRQATLSKEATKIKRHRNRRKHKKRSKKTYVDLTLDNDAEPTNDEYSSESSETTGGDTDSNEIKMVGDLIFKYHGVKPEYSSSIPVYVDPADTDRFFYITLGMARAWAKEKIECDENGSKVVTIAIPPKGPESKWMSRTTEQSKRNKTSSSSDSTLRDMAIMIKQVFGPLVPPPSDALDSSSEQTLKAPMSAYLSYCEIPDIDGLIKGCLDEAGIDQYILFDEKFLPRQVLVDLNLRPGVITRLYMNVKGFAKKLNKEQQPDQKAKIGIKIYHHSKMSFAAGPRKYRRKAMLGGKVPWLHPKRYHQFYTNKGIKREDIHEKNDLRRYNQANELVWRSQKQAEAHPHFFFLKGALAEVQNNIANWLFTPTDYLNANQVLRHSSNAKKFHEQPVEERKNWLEARMFKPGTQDFCQHQ